VAWSRGGYLLLYAIEGHAGYWYRLPMKLDSRQVGQLANSDNIVARANRRGCEGVYRFKPGPTTPEITRKEQTEVIKAIEKLCARVNGAVTVSNNGRWLLVNGTHYEGINLADALRKAMNARK